MFRLPHPLPMKDEFCGKCLPKPTIPGLMAPFALAMGTDFPHNRGSRVESEEFQMTQAPQKQAAVLTDQRITRALQLCRNERERAMFLLSVRAGLRACEIAGLTWQSVDFEQAQLRLTVTKGNKVRIVPLHSEVASALEAYRNTRPESKVTPDARVFVNSHSRPGEPLTPNAVTCWFKAFYEKAGWQGYSSHSGRRTFLTKAARKASTVGASLKDLQALAGHADVRTTMRYVETDPEAQRKLVALL